MPAPAPVPLLRLSSAELAPPPANAAHAVAAANLQAAGLRSDDPRWVLAARVASLLDGGRAAILSPDRRRAIMSLAHLMGLRTFDAALIIAVVQDAARTGRDWSRTPGLPPDVAARLALIRPPEATDSPAQALPVLVSVAIAAALFSAATWWLSF